MSDSTGDPTTPLSIEQGGPRELRIRWGDGVEMTYDVVFLRRACRCAHCIDEWSGEKLLKPEDVPEDIRPLRVEPCGRYAIHIRWSDGHTSGIYTYDYLRQLGAKDARSTD